MGTSIKDYWRRSYINCFIIEAINVNLQKRDKLLVLLLRIIIIIIITNYYLCYLLVLIIIS